MRLLRRFLTRALKATGRRRATESPLKAMPARKYARKDAFGGEARRLAGCF
jgi:hypothetical protein